MIRSTFAFALSTLALFAQEPTKPTAPPAAAVPLPAANSPEAAKVVEQAIAKMAAYGRGSFSTSESQDAAMMRGAGMPFGGGDTEVKGGWHREVVWGEHDGSDYVKANGRMLAKVGDGWKLRASKLGAGKPAPFTLDPALLFALLQELPAEARAVVHVEAGEVASKPVTILSLQLDGDAATEFMDSGVLPAAGGGGFVMFGGVGGMPMPQVDHTVYLAFSIDESGDVLRFAAKVYEKNGMFGGMQVAIAVNGQGVVEEEKEEEKEEEEEKADAPVVWKKGFPKRKPAKDESVVTFRADFSKLGRAEPPQLGDKEKALLRLH